MKFFSKGKVSAMKNWLKTLSGMAAALLLAGGALAAPQAATPSAEQVISNYVKAVGGKAALEKVKSRVTKGTVDPGMGTLFTLELREKAPDKSLSVIDVPEQGQVKQGFDGKVAWDSTPNQGVQELSGAMLAAVRRNSQFYRWLHMKELFGNLGMAGTTKVGDRDAFVMQATPADGYPEKFYFDTQTGLLIKREYQLDSPGGVLSFETFYDDYREVDGVKLPFTLRRVGPDNVLLLKFTEIKHNVELDDAQFAKPTAP